MTPNISQLTATAWNIRERYRGKIIAFCAIMPPHTTPGGPAYGVGVAVLGEPGYSIPQERMPHESYESASQAADILNQVLGLSDETATVIIAETMSRQRFKDRQRDEADNFARHYLVRVEFMRDGRIDDVDEDGIIQVLSEALEDIAYGDEHGTLIQHVEVAAA